MSAESDSPVSIIEGIGPATAQRLSEAGIYNVFDLLRVTASEIHSVVDDIASESEVAQWQAMARFLEIEPMTPQWAEGLVCGGIETVQELTSKSVSDVDATLTKARDEGRIPDVPETEQIVDMLRDAAVVYHTGTLTLTVFNKSGHPVNNADADIGDISDTTDARGRVRLVRIPLGFEQTLRVQHDDYGVLLLHDAPVSADPAAISVTRVGLPNAGDPDDAATVTLSEYEGDEIPSVGNMPTREVVLAATELRDEDLLVVRKFYSRTPDVQLVSMLRDSINGETVVYAYRVPLSEFGERPDVGEMFTYENGSFAKYRSGVHTLNRYRVGRRMKKHFANVPESTTPEEAIQDKTARFQFYVDQGACAGSRRSRR